MSRQKNNKHGSLLPIYLSLGAVVFFFVASGCVSYWNTRILNKNAQKVAYTHEIILELENLLSIMKDAETGQRGFLITGDEKYLDPYNHALARVSESTDLLESRFEDSPVELTRLKDMKAHIAAKLAELNETIVLRRNQGFDAARVVVVTDRGKNDMDVIRNHISALEQEENDIRNKRLEEMDNAYYTAVASGVLTGLLGILLSAAVATLMQRSALARQKQQWLQTGQVGLNAALAGEQKVEQLGESLLTFLAEYLGAQAGVFFTKDGGHYRRVAVYGVPANSQITEKFEQGDSLLGQAVRGKRSFLIHDIPEGYLTIGSGLGQSKPRHLIIAPALYETSVNGVLELGFIHPIDASALELLERVSETIAIALRSANYRLNLQNYLEETQRQAEELQAQSEELRVSNEELEEQSRALKASQTSLEQQQAELEQTNSQLEEQTQLLETQRDDIAQSKAAVQIKAQELEQASQYKSDFLANMSHELRTPLNSSLILAKLLADNPAGNLSAEQVKYAQTIQSSGNDLLALINDILDLSKIEAGHMEIRAEPVLLTRLMSDLTRVFDPLAKQKGLIFKTTIDKNCSDVIDTDRQRLEQILKNLLSNALKFTERGTVELLAALDKNGKIAFSASDTGIGIAPQQQQAIFDAFRQADGTISRKYGGTGLGLSISRELARLLGGAITLTSTQGQGSVFTLTIPITYDASLAKPHKASTAHAQPIIPVKSFQPVPASVSDAPAYSRPTDDDRQHLNGDSRILLVVEDDVSFARILYDLAHELDFQCLLAHTAEDAVIMAKQYLPSAIIMDIGLPDHSGLSVLDRLKHDTHTRHIPVHVVSANDYAQTALSLGAVGYMMKPVKRDDLSQALKKLETRLSQRMRSVLIVEDDPVQRDSMSKLLASHDVKTVGVGTAAECLRCLKETTFDCMVLDLSLPDATGYSLLETLSKEDAYSFPPVIVYTGHELSADEEQRLRRYSKSIIIKGVKSPERLLDEVTLFLHQVVSELPVEQQRMLEKARNRDAVLEGRRILIVEDDVRNVYALTNILEPQGAIVQIARNGVEALTALASQTEKPPIELVLMDVMMPEMDGLTATREIRKKPEWKKLPIIMLTAKAMRDDQERCLEAGANDYMAKPLDVDKLLSLVRVWMPR